MSSLVDFALDIVKLIIGVSIGTYLGSKIIERKIKKAIEKYKIEDVAEIIQRLKVMLGC